MSDVPDSPTGIPYTIQEARHYVERHLERVPDPYARDMFRFLVERVEDAPDPDGLPAVGVSPGYAAGWRRLEELKKTGELGKIMAQNDLAEPPPIGDEAIKALSSADPQEAIGAYVRSRGESGLRVVFRPGLPPEAALHWLNTFANVLTAAIHKIDLNEVMHEAQENLRLGKLPHQQEPPAEEELVCTGCKKPASKSGWAVNMGSGLCDMCFMSGR